MPASQVSFFGKLPCALDYVRIQHVSDAGIAFDRWLERAQQELARLNASWPSARFRFVFPFAKGEVLVGVMAPSRDRAGRRFPASVYATITNGLTARPGLVPTLFAAFFAEAERLLEESLHASIEQLTQRLTQVPLPSPSALSEAEHSRQDLLASRSLLDFAQADFASDVAAADHALRRFSQALANVGVNKVVCCPAQEESDVTVWMSLAEQKMDAATHGLWAFWTREVEVARVYLGRGEIPCVLPVWVAGASVKSERFWDLRFTPTGASLESSAPETLLAQGESSPSLDNVFRKMLAL